MNGLTILAALVAALTLYGLNTLRLERDAARQAARHADRLRQIAEHQRDAARAERDEALDFADETSLLLGVASHPVGRDRRHLAVVVDR